VKTHDPPEDPLKLKAFCLFSYKRGAKVPDLSDSSPPCLRQTASLSHNWPLLLVSGRRLHCLPMPGSTPDADADADDNDDDDDDNDSSGADSSLLMC